MIETKFKLETESDGSTSLLNASDGFYAVESLSRQFTGYDPTYAQRQVRFAETYDRFVERPNFDNQLEMRRALATGYATEAHSTSDMPLLFADTMNRTLLGEYLNIPLPDFRPYVSIGRFNDLFEKPFYGLSMASKALDPINELGEYKERSMREEQWKYKIGKYGNRFAFSFEFFLKNDMDIFNRSLRALALGAKRREYRTVTGLFVGASGPNTNLYKTNHTDPNTGVVYSNIVPGNPAFTPAGFEAAMNLMGTQVDADGEPIVIDMVHLVIPPGLEQTVRNLFTATNWEVTIGTATVQIPNPYSGRVTVHINPYIPIIASTANGNSSWFLFADPRNGRPAIEVGYLAGYEQPQLFIKSPNQERVGGGRDFFQGSFENDSLENKIRMFIGGAQFDPHMTVMSDGSGVGG